MVGVNVTTTVEYILGQLAGLDVLRGTRASVENEQELAYWKLAAEKWFFKNEILRQFDRRQVRVDMGRNHPITIMEEHPELDLRGWFIRPDRRLEHHANLVSGVRLLTTFERQPGEADPRGGYRHLDAGNVATAFVSLDAGEYRMSVDMPNTHSELARLMEELSRFALNIIRGRLKPEAFTTVP